MVYFAYHLLPLGVFLTQRFKAGVLFIFYLWAAYANIAETCEKMCIAYKKMGLATFFIVYARFFMPFPSALP